MTASPSQIGARIRERRQMLGLSLEDVADAVGVTFQTLSRYERGSRPMLEDTLAEIAVELNCSVAHLKGEGSDESPLSRAALRAARDIDSLSVGRRRTMVEFIAKLAKEEPKP